MYQGVEEMRNVYNILAGKHEKGDHLGDLGAGKSLILEKV